MNCGKVLLPTLPQLTGVQQIYPVHPRLEDTTLPLTLVRSLGLKKELRGLARLWRGNAHCEGPNSGAGSW